MLIALSWHADCLQVYFGPALDKYAGRKGETYRTALGWRATLLMSGAAICLSKLQLSGGGGHAASPRDASATLITFEEWASVWPWLVALDDRLREAGLAGLQLYGEPLNLSALMAPLVGQYITYLTIKFDDELEVAWRRETWKVGIPSLHADCPLIAC